MGVLFPLLSGSVLEFIVCVYIFLFVILLSVMSRGFIRNNLSTSFEVVVGTAYTLSSPDPILWEYIGYVVAVYICVYTYIYSKATKKLSSIVNSFGS